LSNIRIKFIRSEEVKYIYNLELMKSFDRAIRRAEIPVIYSQGFNPHPNMVFGLPLSVGVTSQAEYADFEVDDCISPDEFMRRINNSLPPGLKVIDAKKRRGKANIMASIGAASYDILIATTLGTDVDAVSEKIKGFLGQACIYIEKQSKKGKKEIDIRPMIIRLEMKKQKHNPERNQAVDCSCKYANSDIWLREYIENLYRGDVLPPSFDRESIMHLSALLSAGSMNNLKPELLVEALEKYTGQKLKVVKIHRTGLFIEKGGKLLEPLDGYVL